MAGPGKGYLDSLDLESFQDILFIKVYRVFLKIDIEDFSAFVTDGVVVGMDVAVKPLASRSGIDGQKVSHVRQDLEGFIDGGKGQGWVGGFHFPVNILGGGVASAFRQNLQDRQALTGGAEA